MEAATIDELKSPLKKLVSFFRQSRNKWKKKYLAKRDESILLANKVRSIEKSRQQWREEARLAQKAALVANKELFALRDELKKMR